MKIGIISGAYFVNTVNGEHVHNFDALNRMKDHGYDAMDYNQLAQADIHFAYHVDECEMKKRMTEMGDKIRAHGIEVNQTHGPWRFPVRHGEEAVARQHKEEHITCLKATAYLGAPYMVVHPMMPFGDWQDPDPEAAQQYNVDFLSMLAKYGEEYGVVSCLETMPFKGTKSISTNANILKIVKAVDSPWVRVCLDTGHCNLFLDEDWCERPVESVKMFGKEYLKTLHVHDNSGKNLDNHWIPYTGTIDWKGFSTALHEIGYEGVVSLETDLGHSMHLPKAQRDYFERGVARLAKQLTVKPE